MPVSFIDATCPDGEIGQVLKIENEPNKAYTMPVIVPDSDKYSFSVWARSDQNTAFAIKLFGKLQVSAIGSEWQRFAVGIDKSDKAGITAAIISMASAPLYIHKAQLETGGTATDWNPSPDDTDAAITDVSNAASTAQSTADSAQTAASTAQSTADSAQTAASTAQSTADSAQTAASTAQSTADSAQTVARNAVSRADFQRIVHTDYAGVHVKDNLSDCEVLIDSIGVHPKVGGKIYSTFAANYVQFGDYQMYQSYDGGIAFKYFKRD